MQLVIKGTNHEGEICTEGRIFRLIDVGTTVDAVGVQSECTTVIITFLTTALRSPTLWLVLGGLALLFPEPLVSVLAAAEVDAWGH